MAQACGGGLRRATAFRYYTEPLLQGDTAGGGSRLADWKDSRLP